jgi:small subunit ribosomal protein S20
MPIIKSAKKRVRVAAKASIRNSKTKRSLKSSLKQLTSKPTSDSLSLAFSNIDKAQKKGIIHKNKAARLKKQASAKAKASNVKVTPKPKTAGKPAPKKTAAKKPAAAKKTK